MTDATDDDVPEGYSRPVNPRMQKAPPDLSKLADATPRAATTLDDDDDELVKAAKALSQAPAAPDHGRPKGANNALAFHQFPKKPPKPDDAG